MNKRIIASLVVAAVPLAAAAQFLLVPDSGDDRIAQFNAFDGSLINLNFIVESALVEFSTPKATAYVNGEIWITDQLEDTVQRFDSAGNYLSTISGQLDNIRGLNVVNGEVWVTNSGTSNSAPGDAIVRYSTSGTHLGSYAVGDPFDVVTNIAGTEAIITNIVDDSLDRYSFGGAFLGTLHGSDGATGIDFPEQIVQDGAGYLVTGFSTPAGVYGYDAAGNQNYYFAESGLRGVHRLGNGNILVSDSSGVSVLNVSTGQLTLVADISGQYIGLVPVPEPATLGVLGLGALALVRRRKK